MDIERKNNFVKIGVLIDEFEDFLSTLFGWLVHYNTKRFIEFLMVDLNHLMRFSSCDVWIIESHSEHFYNDFDAFKCQIRCCYVVSLDRAL